MPRLRRLVVVPVLTVAAAAAAVAVPAGAAYAHTDNHPRFIPLHAQPSGGARVVGRLAKGDRFTTHQSRGSWTFITDRTTRTDGWVHFEHPHHTAPRSSFAGVHD